MPSHPPKPNGNGSSAPMDRLPPHALDAEKAVLGSCLLDPNETLPKLLASQGCELFYDLRHQAVAEAMAWMHLDLAPIDSVTLYQRLRDTGDAEQVGGAAFIAELSGCVPSAANFDYYLKILEDKLTLRRILRVSAESASRVYEQEADPEECLNKFEQSALGVRAKGTSDLFTAQQVVELSTDLLEKNVIAFQQGAPSGMATGYADIDSRTCGLQTDELVIVGARPSIGKSTLLMNLVERMAVGNSIPTGVISLEMSKQMLMMRMESSLSHVPFWRMREGSINELETQRILVAKAKILKAPIVFWEGSGMTVPELRFQVRKMVKEHGVKVVWIDYLQLLHAGRRIDNRANEIGYISAATKELAREHHICVGAASQLNRDCERRDEKVPTLADLRESGNIEQDADLVWLLHTSTEGKTAPVAPVELHCAKQRNGPQFVVQTTFLKGICRFESVAKVSDADVPQTQTSLPYSDQ